MSVINVEKSKRKHTKNNEETNLYYNIRVTKPYDPATVSINVEKPITFSTSRTSPVLENPNDYELAVVRFYLPAEVPIFVINNIPGSPGYDENIWQFCQVGLEYDGSLEIVDLIYDPYCPPCLPVGSILFYQEFIDMINTAYETAYNQLLAVKPGLPPTAAPYLIYNANTELFSLLAQTAYNSQLANPVKIYLNINVFNRFFPSLPLKDIVDLGISTFAQLRIQDNKNNTSVSNPSVPIGYYEMLQEYRTLSLWNDLQTVLLETNQIPVEPEFEPSDKDITKRLLTDFEPFVQINNREAFQYQPQGALRWMDLKSNYPLNNIDLRVYWQSKTGQVYPLPLLQGQSATLKIRFRNKHTKDYYDEDLIY